MSNLITVDSVGGFLDQIRGDIEPLVIDSGKSFDRLKSVFLIAVQQNQDILKCSTTSIKREILKCAADGLVPDNKEAAMIPYKGELQYQPMVMGIIKRVKELGGVFSIVCKLVHENDEFVLNEADPDSLLHKSNPFATAKDRGAVTGGYAVFRDDQKRVMHLETMSIEDFVKVRNASKAPDSPAWKNWTNEMYRKAVLRRGSKYVPINNDKIRALLERQDEMFDQFNTARQTERVNPFTGEVIEHDQTKAVTDQSQTGVKMDAGASQEREKEPAKQSQPKSEQRSEQASQTGQGSKPKQEAKKEEPSGPPSAPDDIMIQREDHDIILEGCEKLLGIALDMGIDAPDRRGVLKQAAQHWASATPDYAKPLMKACIDMTDWAIKRDADKLAWSAEHAMFVHKVKSLLGVEKLNVGKYP
ncbi:hypothetical protein EHE22_16555 [Ochrobactrum pseudogrignonense]|uniref:Recombinase RecT n=1 Tax=Brucella pseudogrignonensis TaxID=419475 RepID=A0A7Y3T742_9HYPH|nr:RecT family recombinase [Brucella pseudogrignonensis]NNV22028.1 hypothetical protein [Brucella pseudogrignonensis]